MCASIQRRCTSVNHIFVSLEYRQPASRGFPWQFSNTSIPYNIGIYSDNIGVDPYNIGDLCYNIGILPYNIGIYSDKKGVDPYNIGDICYNIGI